MASDKQISEGKRIEHFLRVLGDFITPYDPFVEKLFRIASETTDCNAPLFENHVDSVNMLL